jgi:hypothetical protein
VNVTYELRRLIADARAHGLTSLDLASLERLVFRAEEHARRDLVDRRRDMLVVGLDDT